VTPHFRHDTVMSIEIRGTSSVILEMLIVDAWVISSFTIRQSSFTVD
jgi:hypothetical protein